MGARQHRMESSSAAPPETALDPARNTGNSRQMVRANLDGSHIHLTADGLQVQIAVRDGKYLARWRMDGRQHGMTLGSSDQEARALLRRLMVELEDGTYVPRREARRRQLTRRTVPKHDLRSLCAAFLADRERVCGPQTMGDYKSRLCHILNFAESTSGRKRWPKAMDLDRGFATELRSYLFSVKVTRNGRDAGTERRMAPKTVRNCLETLRSVLNWACRATVRQLPPDFVNPIDDEVLGPKPAKDPYRENPIPLQQRIEVIRRMDAWQLVHLAPLLVLPTRFEDLSGALVGDFDFAAGHWSLGSRFQGNDFNKVQSSLRMPLPPELRPLLIRAIGGRSDGPMFCSRSAWSNERLRQRATLSSAKLQELVDHELSRADAAIVQTLQGRKQVVRRTLQKLGAVSTDAIGRELRSLFDAVGIGWHVRPYDIRAAVTTEMNQSGMPILELEYLTVHRSERPRSGANRIVNEYAAQNPQEAMARYFARIQPLLTAIVERANTLGLSAVDNLGRNLPSAGDPQTADHRDESGARLVHSWCTGPASAG